MIEKIQNLYSTVKPYLSVDGKNATSISYIDVYCYNQKEFVLSDTTNPYLMLVINGNMRLRFAEGIYDYIPGQYFISAIDCPRTGELISLSETSPFVALRVEFSVDDVISVMLDIDGDLPHMHQLNYTSIIRRFLI